MTERRENINDPFSICFNMLKMKYREYDESITNKNFLKSREEKVNVFINLESVYKYLSMIPDLEKKIVVEREFETIIISNIINLIAHYYKFFRGNGLDTKVYIYDTDLRSTEFEHQYKYNEFYRAYYLSKYNKNPKFVLLSDHLKDSILPKVKTICDFIPNVHYVSSINMEGSLIPYTIYQLDTSRKNFIVGSECYDTQYSQIPNFVNHLIVRGWKTHAILSSLSDYIKGLVQPKETDSVEEIMKIIGNYPMYCTLMSVMGDKLRSIESIYGYGPKTLLKDVKKGYNEQIIMESTTSPELISDIFSDNSTKKEFVNNFYCTSIIPMYEELTESEKSSITNQIIDRIDINSLQALNSTKFYNHPLMLNALLF